MNQSLSILNYLEAESLPWREIGLLLACARTRPQDLDLEAIRSLVAQPIQWNVVSKLAHQQGIVPIIYQTLKSLNQKLDLEVPKDTIQTLRKTTQTIAFRNTVFAGELFKILQLLEQHNIPVLPFKGPVLASSLYGNLGVRPFGDLDILVMPADFLEAFDLLLDHEFRPVYEWHLLDVNLERGFRRRKGEYPLTNGVAFLDLHQYLTVERFLSARFTFDYLWSRRKTVIIAKSEINTFGEEDLLMYLCIHGSKDCWRGLKWICDVAEFVRTRPQLDWGKLMQQAEVMGCDRMVLIGLSLAKTLLNVELPPVILESIEKDPTSQALTADFSRYLFQPNPQLGRKFTIDKFRLHLQLVKQARDKVGCFLDLERQLMDLEIRLMPNHKDYDFLALPKALHFIYLLIRPVRLSIKHLSRQRKAT